MVSLAVSEALYRRHPLDDEGVLSARRAAIVSTPGLARLAARLDLGSYLLLGEGEAQRGGRVRPSLLASAFEALVGAIYLDLGWDAARDWIHAARRGRDLGRPRADHAQEPQEPAPGAHPAHDRATGPSTASSRRSGRTTRSSSGSRSLVEGRVLGHRRGAVAPDRRDRRPPPRRSRCCARSERLARPGRRGRRRSVAQVHEAVDDAEPVVRAEGEPIEPDDEGTGS